MSHGNCFVGAQWRAVGKEGPIPALVEPPPQWQNVRMSTLATNDPKELRPLLRERIERATDEELEAVRKALLKLELDRLMAEMGKGAQADWEAGKLAPELVEAAIREHRAKYPYRRRWCSTPTSSSPREPQDIPTM